jgi:uncharacterized protein (DUF2147 family)
MKDFRKILVLIFLLSINFSLYSQTSDAILGKWYNTEKDAQIEIYKEGGKFFGKVIWLQNPDENGQPFKDRNNADESKRDRPIIGLKLLHNFEYNGGTWENGTIYDPKNGKTYSCIIKKKDNKTLEVRGYVGISLIGRTVEWTKAE